MSNINHVNRIVKHVKGIEKISTYVYRGWIPDMHPNGSRYDVPIENMKKFLKLKKIITSNNS